MSEMKWIKIVTDIVDDEKMLMIEMLCPNGAKRDAVQLMWFNVLALAGKLNEGGRLAVNGIPMDTKALGKKFRRTTRTVEFAFDLFMKLGMIRQDKDGAYYVTNWGRYQSDMSEKADKAEYDKKRYQDKKVKAETLKSEKESEIKVKKSENFTFSTEQNKNKEIEEEINISSSSSEEEDTAKPISEDDEEENKFAERVVECYNRICTSYPKVENITAMRRDMITRSKKELHAGVADYVKIFTYARDNDFLKGKDGKKSKNWQPTFDWIINPQNATRILEGAFFTPKNNDHIYDGDEIQEQLLAQFRDDPPQLREMQQPPQIEGRYAI